MPHCRHASPVIAGICAAFLFVGMTTYRLERTGLYYDELHQATGSFAYVGRPTTMFSLMPIWGMPLLNMNYSGAIKTAIYGLYLRVSGRPFSIISWRLLGIVFSAAGIIAFCVLAGDRLPMAGLVLFLGLLLTDTNFLLQSRHDWGPVALAFFLRMIFIGVWLGQLNSPARRKTSFLLGLIVGIAIFEKLSSALLLGPLAVMLLSDFRIGAARNITWALVGVGCGALPVILANVYSFIMDSTLLALSSTSSTVLTLGAYAANYVALGNGEVERVFMFTVPSLPWAAWVEGFAVAASTLLIGAVAWSKGKTDPIARIAGVGLVSYLFVAIGLRYLPAATAENHWIIGTPFQYLAMVLTVAPVWSSKPVPMKVARILCLACVVILLLARGPALVSAFEAIRDDKYTAAWDPSVNAAASFAAGQPENVAFIAADWGIATQVFCLANGRQDFVFEPFWNFRGRETLDQILDQQDRQLVVVAAPKPRPLVQGEATAQIFDAMATSHDWKEIKLDPRIYSLGSIEMHVFRRTSHIGIQ